MDSQAVRDLALRFQQTHFPNATLVLLTGSWAMNSARGDSDIDLFMLDPTRPDVLFEGVLFESCLFDVCVVRPDQLDALFRASVSHRSGPTVHQVMRHRVIAGSPEQAGKVVERARTVVETGPAELLAEERDELRWQLSTQLAEFGHVAAHELPSLSARCYCLLARTHLAVNRRWQGEGKSLHRLLVLACPEVAARLDAALVAACSGEPAALLQLGRGLLADMGGPLRTYRETYTL